MNDTHLRKKLMWLVWLYFIWEGLYIGLIQKIDTALLSLIIYFCGLLRSLARATVDAYKKANDWALKNPLAILLIEIGVAILLFVSEKLKKGRKRHIIIKFWKSIFELRITKIYARPVMTA